LITLKFKKPKIYFKLQNYNDIYAQRELFKYTVLELRKFVLKNRVSTFWYQCSQYLNEMVKREKLS